MDTEPQEDAVIDLTEGAELINTTAKQTRLVEGLLMGMNKTAAAKRAGYEGEGVGLRSTASQASRSDKVLALLAWAESKGKGVPDSPGDREELRRILWRHSRSKDKNISIKATEALERIMRHDAEKQAEDEKYQNPRHKMEEILDEIAKTEPELAVHYAYRHGFNWKPKGLEDIRRCPECRQLMADRHDAAPQPTGEAA